MARRPDARAAALLLLGLLFSGTSQAHPFAVSEFEAKTDGRAVGFSFRFDTTSVVDLVNRARPGVTPIGPEALTAQRAIVERYVQARFRVSNDGVACTDDGLRRYELDAGKVRMLVDLRYVCASDLRTLELRSTLFQDETTPHQIIGTLSHKNALERYFFTGGERVATIKLDELRQGGRPAVPSLSGVRIVPPPAGVKWGKPQSAAAPVSSTATPEPGCSGAACGKASAEPALGAREPSLEADESQGWSLPSKLLLGALVGIFVLAGWVLARRGLLRRGAAQSERANR